MAAVRTPPYQAFTLYFVQTFVPKNTCPNPSCHLFEQNMGNCSRLWMKHHGRMLGITFQWNKGAGGVKTPKHAKQHGKHGLNFSFSRIVFCDNFEEVNGLNNHTISPKSLLIRWRLGERQGLWDEALQATARKPQTHKHHPPSAAEAWSKRATEVEWLAGLGRASQAIHRLGSPGLAYDTPTVRQKLFGKFPSHSRWFPFTPRTRDATSSPYSNRTGD